MENWFRKIELDQTKEVSSISMSSQAHVGAQMSEHFQDVLWKKIQIYLQEHLKCI